jgi:hypothetical protein
MARDYEELPRLPMTELIELGDTCAGGVPIATPVFDGAREPDIVPRCWSRPADSLRSGHCSTTAVPASRSTAR